MNVETKTFNYKSHIKYFQNCLNLLPSFFQSEEGNKLALIYFCLSGLNILDAIDFDSNEKEKLIESIYENYLIENDEIVAFRSNSFFKQLNNKYDIPNLASTFFGLSILLILKSDFSKRIDFKKLVNFLSLCQIKIGPDTGSFVSTLLYNFKKKKYEQVGELSMRFCYIALIICHFIKYKVSYNYNIELINKEKLIQFILKNISYEGGFGINQNNESHLGLTFCALASLKLLNYSFDENFSKFKKMLSWLVKRQVGETFNKSKNNMKKNSTVDESYGGFNGRENKEVDSCYSWWCTASLKIIGSDFQNLFDKESAYKYLINQSQSEITGGFKKNCDIFPDPYHSFLSIATLSKWNSDKKKNKLNKLKNFNDLLMITDDLLDFLNEKIIFNN